MLFSVKPCFQTPILSYNKTKTDLVIKMSEENNWIYVIVLSPGEKENLFGIYDPAEDINFIPFFQNRDEAIGFIYGLKERIEEDYEIQAFLLDELAEIASQSSFLIAPVDGRGHIITS